MKKLLVILLFTFTFYFSFAQSGWYPVDKGVYGDVEALSPYDSVLFVGGNFYTAGGIGANCIAQWNGKSWGTVGQGVKRTNGHIAALAMYHGKLYAGGEFDSAGGKAANAMAVWDGASWAPVGNWVGNRFAEVDGLCVYNNELYVTGGFDSAGAIAVNNIARWNDTVWAPVGLGLTGPLAGGVCMAVYRGKLYVGGGFDSAGGIAVTSIASWDGVKWDSVGHTKWDGGIYALCSYDSILYMGGVFHYPGFDSLEDLNHINYIAQWNDSAWDSVGTSYATSFYQVFSLGIYNGDLIAGGTSYSGNIARWNGHTWSAMDTGMDNGISAIAVYNGYIYAAGGFDSAGGRFAANIAVWGNNTFTGEENLKNAMLHMNLYPNPNNGNFTLEYNLGNETGGKVKLYNAVGEMVGEYTLDNAKGKMNISNSELSNGIYIWKLYTNNSMQFGKVVIMK